MNGEWWMVNGEWWMVNDLVVLKCGWYLLISQVPLRLFTFSGKSFCTQKHLLERLKFSSKYFSLKTPSGLAALSMSSTSGGDLTNTKVIVQKKSNKNNPKGVFQAKVSRSETLASNRLSDKSFSRKQLHFELGVVCTIQLVAPRCPKNGKA